MGVPEKELELLQGATDKLQTNISRVSLVQVSLLAFVVFAFANAFKQIDPQLIAQKSDEIRKLSAVSRTPVESYNLGRFDEFFILGGLVGDPPSRDIEVGELDDSSWDKARDVLINYPEGKAAIDKFENPKKEAFGEAAATDERSNTNIVEELDSESSLKLPPEIILSAKNLQHTLSLEVHKSYNDAFTKELSIVGSKIYLDLRNWAVFLPFLFLLSQVYLLIQKKKLRLINAIAAERVEGVGNPAANTVPTAYRLFLDGVSARTAYARHPAQFISALTGLGVATLGIYLVVASRPFFAGVDLVEGLFVITVPTVITLVIAVSYCLSYYWAVSSQLEEQILQSENISLRPSALRAFRDKVRSKLRKLQEWRKPRAWITTGGALVLISLVLTVSVDSCGSPKRGYEFVKRPAVIESGLQKDGTYQFADEDTTAWWPTALISLMRINDTPKMNRKMGLLIAAHEHLAWILYVTAIGLSLVSMVLVGLSIFVPSVLGNKVVPIVFSVGCGLVSLFFIADICFYYISPLLKSVLLLAYWIVPMLLFLLLGFSTKPGRSARWFRCRSVIGSMLAPLTTLLTLFLVSTVVHAVLDIAVGTRGAMGIRVVATIAKQVLSEDLGVGLFSLILGINLLWLGWRQLRQISGSHLRGGT